jgi:hypothetical protein
MRVTPVMVVCVAVAAGLFAPAARAQSARDYVIATWAGFLEVCGPLLVDPDGAESHARSVPSQAGVQFFETQGGAAFHAISMDFESPVYWNFWVHEVSNGHAVQCEYGAASFGQDAGLLQATLTELLQGNEDMSFRGGAVAGLPGSAESVVGPLYQDSFVFAVEGVFPGADSLTTVLVDSESLNLLVHWVSS